MEISINLDMSSLVAVVKAKIWMEWDEEKMKEEKLEQHIFLEILPKKRKIRNSNLKGKKGENCVHFF